MELFKQILKERLSGIKEMLKIRQTSRIGRSSLLEMRIQAGEAGAVTF